MVQRIAKLFVSLSKSQLFIFIISIILFIEIVSLKFGYRLAVNVSNSLPFHVFIVDTKDSSRHNIERNNYIQFYNKNTKYYEGRKFTKKVLAVGGDVLNIEQLETPIDNIQAIIKFRNVILEVKDYTTLGTKVYTNNIAVIPKDMLFVVGTHRESFDSRYMEFGLIKKSEVLGVAKPLF
jgi:type IV secretory pathway protease TraF